MSLDRFQLVAALPCVRVISCFSRVRLFASLWTVAPEAPLSLGILQARIPEWVAMPSSKGSSWPRGWNQVSHISWTSRWVLYWFLPVPPGKPSYSALTHTNKKGKKLDHILVETLSFPLQSPEMWSSETVIAVSEVFRAWIRPKSRAICFSGWAWGD